MYWILLTARQSGIPGQHCRCLGVSFPRSRLPRASERSEIDRTDVYVLWGPGDSEDIPRAYVGESNVLKSRLASHASSKDFWTHCIAFVSKDQNLNKAHVRYMEWRMIGLAREAHLCDLQNSVNPNEPALSEADQADAELFLADMLQCLPVVGVTFFTKPRRPEEDSHLLTVSAKGVTASGYEDTNGFVVQSGSEAVASATPSFHAHLRELKRSLGKSGVLIEEQGSFRFKVDYRFNSPSAAASVVLGANSNGRELWKDSNGRSLNDLANLEASS